MGYEAKKTEHSGPKRGNGAYWAISGRLRKKATASAVRTPNAKSATRQKHSYRPVARKAANKKRFVFNVCHIAIGSSYMGTGY